MNALLDDADDVDEEKREKELEVEVVGGGGGVGYGVALLPVSSSYSEFYVEILDLSLRLEFHDSFYVDWIGISIEI